MQSLRIIKPCCKSLSAHQKVFFAGNPLVSGLAFFNNVCFILSKYTKILEPKDLNLEMLQQIFFTFYLSS